MRTYTFSTDWETTYNALVNACPIGGDIERAFHIFAHKVAGRELYASGVYLAWGMIASDLAKEPGATPMIAGILHAYFEDLMGDLLADNPVFLAEVVKFSTDVKNDAKGGQS